MRDLLGYSVCYDQIDGAVMELECLLLSGQINTRFKAIFIDEAQIFQPQWIDICYLLLQEPKKDSSLVIAGDLNQDVKSLSKRGQAVWQRAKQIPSGGFRGRISYLKKNYQNTKEINDYLNEMISHFTARSKALNLVDKTEYEETYGTTTRLGQKPYIELGMGRENITRKVVDRIEHLHKAEHIIFNDIAVLFPYRWFRYVDYHIHYWMKAELDTRGIPHSTIRGDITSFLIGNDQTNFAFVEVAMNEGVPDILGEIDPLVF